MTDPFPIDMKGCLHISPKMTQMHPYLARICQINILYSLYIEKARLSRISRRKGWLFMKKSEQMLFSRMDIAKIIAPLILQGILSIAIGMIDSMMVSNKGTEAFAGVSLVGSLDTLLITLFSALTSGGAVVLAQAVGRGDQKRACDAAKQLWYATTAAATAIAVVVLVLRRPLLQLLFGAVEEGVMQNALAYFSFIALSFPFLAIENSVSATFRAQGDSMISLKISASLPISATSP